MCVNILEYLHLMTISAKASKRTRFIGKLLHHDAVLNVTKGVKYNPEQNKPQFQFNTEIWVFLNVESDATTSASSE